MVSGTQNLSLESILSNSNTKREIPFSTFKELSMRAANREVVLFGAGTISPKTARKIDHSYAFIADNNPNFWGATQEGKEILNPEVLDGKRDQFFVVICTTSFIEVCQQLERFGFRLGEDFIVSPILNDLRIISELEEHQCKLLFTSGVPESDDPECGGGIYELTLNGHNWAYRKVYSGICYGLIKYKEHYITVDDKRGIVELDQQYKITRESPLPLATRGHGIAYSDLTDCFYVVASYRDEILIFNSDLKHKDSIRLSNKFELEEAPAHHCNDICVAGSSFYVTMFSYSGNWKKDVFDGVILEYDLTTLNEVGPLLNANDLWMPHNISYLDGSLVVLDSLRGELKKNNLQSVGKFPAFTRGLDFDGAYYYVGQSRNRNYSKNLGLSLNISIDSGIIIFDEETKASRTIFLPQKLSEIHSILVIK